MNTDIFKQFGEELDAQNVQPLGQPTNRRAALSQFGKLGLGAAALVVPFIGMAEKAHAAKYGSFRGGGNDLSDPEILNFALTLEWLEYYFYLKGTRDGDILDADRPLFNSILNHEDQHVQLLTGALNTLGVTPVEFEEGDFDFSVNGADPFAEGSYELFLALSQGFEDTGVRAYKGQAASISGASRPGLGSYLTIALQIHSVEARHAAAVRMIRNGLTSAYITGNTTDEPAIQAVYNGEETTVQGAGAGGGDLVSIFSGNAAYTRARITQSFDEPLNDEEVLAIANPFFVPQP